MKHFERINISLLDCKCFISQFNKLILQDSRGKQYTLIEVEK